jgi:hypothetical protein
VVEQGSGKPIVEVPILDDGRSERYAPRSDDLVLGRELALRFEKA